MRRYLILFLFSISFIAVLSLILKKELIEDVFTSKRINKIKLINNKHIPEELIFSKINVKENQIFWLFNPFAFKRDLDSIREIQNYNFKLGWDGVLTIRIEEKMPFMLWVDDDKNKYIDQNGNILQLKINDPPENFIRLFGEDANQKIAELSDALKNNIFILKDVDKILYKKNIGWQIKLIDNNCIFLPIKKLDKLIKMFENISNSDLYDRFSFFDFRIIGRVYMSNKEC